MKYMDDISITAKINALVEQRNNALNQCVNLAGEIAVLKEKLRILEEQNLPEVVE